jgi:hypothetical protein
VSRRLLECVGKRDELWLAPRASQQFDANGQTIRREAGGYHDRRQARIGAKRAVRARLGLAHGAGFGFSEDSSYGGCSDWLLHSAFRMHGPLICVKWCLFTFYFRGKTTYEMDIAGRRWR